MYRTLCSPMLCKSKEHEKEEDYQPITMSAMIFPIVIIIVIFVIVVIYLYKK